MTFQKKKTKKTTDLKAVVGFVSLSSMTLFDLVGKMGKETMTCDIRSSECEVAWLVYYSVKAENSNFINPKKQWHALPAEEQPTRTAWRLKLFAWGSKWMHNLRTLSNQNNTKGHKCGMFAYFLLNYAHANDRLTSDNTIRISPWLHYLKQLNLDTIISLSREWTLLMKLDRLALWSVNSL